MRGSIAIYFTQPSTV